MFGVFCWCYYMYLQASNVLFMRLLCLAFPCIYSII